MSRIYIIVFIVLSFNCINAQLPTDTFLFNINKLVIPIGNDGTIGAIDLGNGPEAKFDNTNIFYSAGFYLTGKINDSLSGNGNFNSHLIDHYIPGKVGTNENNPNNRIFILKSNDSHFGSSWEDWANAVTQGANFYDGDNDGRYNPIDKNSNGKWDTNEDQPGMIGDLVAWTTFNDGEKEEYKNFGFKEIKPMGINIEQTMFAFNKPSYPLLDNVVFIRYEIENSGLISNSIDSVYFGIIVDTDIGYQNDDLAGSIPKNNSGYSYNNGSDDLYGNNAPCFFVNILEGPPYYKTGVSFIDNNNNGFFEEAYDIALDTATFNYGPILGQKLISGSSNSNLRSFTVGGQRDPFTGSPSNPTEMYNLLLGGKQLNGDSIYVSSWQFGNGDGLGIDTTNIESRFMYSGNPIDSIGWLNNFQQDNRILLSVGPFRLEINKNAELLFSFIVGRGEDNLISISKAISIDSLVKEIHSNNFNDIINSVEKKETHQNNFDFHLYQNYPNPFNSTTNISFFTPIPTHINLKLFNILGQEVQILFNEYYQIGYYTKKVVLNNLPTGLYYYQVNVGNKTYTKKMILLK